MKQMAYYAVLIHILSGKLKVKYLIYWNSSRTSKSSRPSNSSCTHARARLSVCGHDRMWNTLARSGQTMAEDSPGLVLLHRGSFFDGRMSISSSAVFANQSSVL